MIVIDRVTPVGDALEWARAAVEHLTPLMSARLIGPLYRYTDPATIEVVLVWHLPDTDAYWARHSDIDLRQWWTAQDAGPVRTRQRDVLAPLPPPREAAS